MSPIFHEFSPTQRVIKPLGRIIAQATKKDEIRATGNDVDRIDLQQRHTLNSRENIRGLRTAAGFL
ncbi:hypothetical protein D3C80_775220 [compost metagenome]